MIHRRKQHGIAAMTRAHKTGTIKVATVCADDATQISPKPDGGVRRASATGNYLSGGKLREEDSLSAAARIGGAGGEHNSSSAAASIGGAAGE